MNVTDALRLIAARAPSVSEQAARAILSSGAAQQMRYDRLASYALGDPDANWSPDERAELVSLISGAASDETRDERLWVRVTTTEKAELETLAAESGMSLSSYIRSRLLS